MFGKSRKYKNGDNFGQNFVNTAFGPEYMRMWAGMSQGAPIAAARADAMDWAYNRELNDEERKMRNTQFQNGLEDRDLQNAFTRGRINKMNAPQPAAPRFDDVYGPNGNLVGQRNSVNNKYSALPQAGSTSAPSRRDFPLPNGQTQKQEYINGKWENFGSPYHSRDPFKQITKINPETGQIEIGYLDTRTLGNERTTDANGEPTGGPEIINLGGKTPPNADQTKAFGFAQRLFDSSSILADVDPTGSIGGSPVENTLDAVPIVGNFLTTPEYQQSEQARLDSTNAILRRESGAAIGKEEIATANKQYFPQPGDRADVINQKRKNLINQYGSLRMAAGPLASQLPPIEDLIEKFSELEQQVRGRAEAQPSVNSKDPLGLFEQ